MVSLVFVFKVPSSLSDGPTVNGSNWNEKPVKLSPQISATEEKWTPVSSAGSKRKNETSAWGKDAGDNGNGKDWGVSLVGRTWGERTLFPGIGKCKRLFLQERVVSVTRSGIFVFLGFKKNGMAKALL